VRRARRLDLDLPWWLFSLPDASRRAQSIAGKPVHASMLLAAARSRGLLLSSAVLGHVLAESAEAGNLEVVRALLAAAGAAGVLRELLMRTDHGVSCLFASAQNGHAEVVRALLAAADAAGVRPELLMCTNESDSRSCLHSDAEKGHVRVLRALLEAADAAGVTHGLLMLRDGNGQSCLSLAVEKDNAKLVPVLLEAAGERKLELLMISCNGDMGPLYVAACRGLPEVVKELLEAAGEQKLLMLNTDSGRVSLHIAAELAHVDVVNVLLAYVAACDPPAQRELLLARRWRGGDAEGQPTGMGCLHVALRTKVRTLSETMVKPLLQVAGTAGVLGELLMMADHKGNTCLHFAVQKWSGDLVKVLLQAAGTACVLAELLMTTNLSGRSCLHAAAKHGDLEVVESLLEAAVAAGVRAELLPLTDLEGRSCLWTADRFHNPAVREALSMEAAVGRSAPTRRRTRFLAHLLYSPVY
jgi:ankyrin repeat protein